MAEPGQTGSCCLQAVCGFYESSGAYGPDRFPAGSHRAVCDSGGKEIDLGSNKARLRALGSVDTGTTVASHRNDTG